MNKIFITIVIIFFTVVFSGCTQPSLPQTDPNYDYSKVFLTEKEMCENFKCYEVESSIEETMYGIINTDISISAKEITFENRRAESSVDEHSEYSFSVIKQSVSDCLTNSCAQKGLESRKEYFVDRQLRLKDGTIRPLDGVGAEAYMYWVEGSGVIFVIARQDNALQEFYFNVNPDKAIPIAKTLVQQGLDKQLRINNG